MTRELFVPGEKGILKKHFSGGIFKKFEKAPGEQGRARRAEER
jgi:hypothetical protein